MLFSACSRNAEPTDPAPPVAGILVTTEVYHPAGPNVRADGKEPIFMGRYPINVLLTFTAGVDKQAVEKALQIDGPAPTVRQWDGNALFFHLPDDEAGPWQFRLPNARHKGQTGFTLDVRRVRENPVKVTVMGQDMDVPRQPSPQQQTWDISGTFARGLPLKPVEMTVEFTYPVRRETVERTVRRWVFGTEKNATVEDIQFVWLSDQKVTMTVHPVAPEVVINWTGAQDMEGLHLWTAGYTLVFSGGRRLSALDPATGKVEVLHTFDRAFDASLLSPDRRRLAVIALPTGEEGRKVGIIDLETGAWTETGKTADSPNLLGWEAADRLKVHQPPREVRHQKRSPDGRWLAEITIDREATAAQPQDGLLRPIPAFLTATDQVDGKVQRHRLHLAPMKYCCYIPTMVWSNDSRQLAYYDALNPQRQLLALQVESGQLRPLVTSDRLPGNQWAGPSGWSPDGTSLLYEGLLVRNGSVEELEGGGPFAYPWSPDGRFLLYTVTREAETDQLVLHDLVTGEKRVVARGVLAGWLEDGRALMIEGASINGIQPPGI